MAHYIDGFVIPVPRSRLDEYKRVAEAASENWKDHGALAYWECVGDDLRVEGVRSFKDLAAATDAETVVFAWVIFESRAARDAANEKIVADPRMTGLVDPENPIFDTQRMAYGGFQALVESENANSE